MEIIVSQTTLNNALQEVRRIVPTKPSLPILSSILLETIDGKLSIQATDLFTGIRTSLPCQITQEGKIALPANLLAETISLLPEGEVLLKKQDNLVQITCKGVTASVACFDPEEYPAFPDKQGLELQLTPDVIEAIVQQVAFACAKDDTRPVLTAINLVFAADRTEVVGTDGFRLSVLHLPAQENLVGQQLLIGAKSLMELAKLVAKDKNAKGKNSDNSLVTMTFAPDIKQVFCHVGQTEMVVRLIDGEYPPYKKIIPVSFQTKVSLDAVEFNKLLKGALVFAKDSSYIVSLTIQTDSVLIKANSTANGNYQAEIPAKVEGNSMEVAFNAHYLQDLLTATKAEHLEISLNDSLQPVQLSVDSVSLLQYIVMPFKIAK